MRGDDVAELQAALARLGFDCGRVDGIYGPETVSALRDFQLNSGLPDDGVCGRDTVRILTTLTRQSGSGPGVMMVREADRFTTGDRSLGRLRIVIGEFGGLGALARQVTVALRQHAASAITVDGSDPSAHASIANRFRAQAYVGFEAMDESVSTLHHYCVPGFESTGGRLLSEHLAAQVPRPWRREDVVRVGTRLPILRETRMPAVLWRMGPINTVVAETPSVVRSVVIAVERWVDSPAGLGSAWADFPLFHRSSVNCPQGCPPRVNNPDPVHQV
jgi:N-acetylmuramoyl-L-alanine amidase